MSKEMRIFMNKFKNLLEEQQNNTKIEFNKEFLIEHKLTKNFIENKISEKEYIKDLNLTINENIFSDISENINQKIIEVLNTFLLNASKIGLKILEKLKTFINWVSKTVLSFREKYPVVFKLINLTILVMVFLIISASLAYASTTNQPISEMHINIAIGFIMDMKEKGSEHLTDTNMVTKAIIYLIRLRESHGVVNPEDIKTFGEASINLANGGLKAAENIIKETNDTQSNTLYKYCTNLIKEGSEYVKYTYEKSGNYDDTGNRVGSSEIIKLYKMSKEK